jgi:hypothetical protein
MNDGGGGGGHDGGGGHGHSGHGHGGHSQRGSSVTGDAGDDGDGPMRPILNRRTPGARIARIILLLVIVAILIFDLHHYFHL